MAKQDEIKVALPAQTDTLEQRVKQLEGKVAALEGKKNAHDPALAHPMEEIHVIDSDGDLRAIKQRQGYAPARLQAGWRLATDDEIAESKGG